MKSVRWCQTALLPLVIFAFSADARAAMTGKVMGNGGCYYKGRYCGRGPAGSTSGKCECGIFFSDTLYLSAYRFEDFNGLAAQALSSFTSPQIRNPDGTFTTPTFGATQVESGTQAGIGAVLRLSDWLALDLGISFGSGTASRTSVQSNQQAAMEKAHFHLLEGHVTAKLYPLQTERVQPWLSAGARGLALRPTEGTYTSGDQRLDIPGRRFQPASATDLVSGAGADIHLTDRLGIAFSGEHGFRTGWRAGAAVMFSIPWR